MNRFSLSRLAMAGLLLGVCTGQGALAAPDMQPGLWETTIRSEMQGMPMTPPPITHQSCITEQDLVPRDVNAAQDCERFDQKIEGNTLTWKAECAQNGMTTRGSGRITYQGQTYTGVFEMEMEHPGMGPMKMKQIMEGRRIGDCPTQ